MSAILPILSSCEVNESPLDECYSRFLNYAHGTKSRNASYMLPNIRIEPLQSNLGSNEETENCYKIRTG